MSDTHKNFAISAVATAPSPASSGTSLVVTTGHGSRFPTPPFQATIWPATGTPDPSNAEVVRVTAVSTDTFTITRAQESSSARTVVVGDRIAATVTGRVLQEAEQTVEIEITQTSHGFVAGDVLYYTGSTYAKAKADAESTAEVIGIVSVNVSTNIFRMVLHGRITGLSGLTAGTTYFLSTATAGALSSTDPTTVGHVSKPLLIADSTTSGYFVNWRGVVNGGADAAAIGVSVYRNGTFSHNSSGNWLAVGMDTEVYDDAGFHDNVTNNSRITIPSGFGGLYVVTGGAWWDNNTTGSRYTRLIKNNTTELGMVGNPSATVLRQLVVWQGRLSATDYVELATHQDSGGTRTVGDATNDAALMLQATLIGV